LDPDPASETLAVFLLQATAIPSLDLVTLAIEFVVFCLLLFTSALVSGSEVALFSIDWAAREQLAEADDRASKRVIRLLEQPRAPVSADVEHAAELTIATTGDEDGDAERVVDQAGSRSGELRDVGDGGRRRPKQALLLLEAAPIGVDTRRDVKIAQRWIGSACVDLGQLAQQVLVDRRVLHAASGMGTAVTD
jgi:hypothetical protein